MGVGMNFEKVAKREDSRACLDCPKPSKCALRILHPLCDWKNVALRSSPLCSSHRCSIWLTKIMTILSTRRTCVWCSTLSVRRVSLSRYLFLFRAWNPSRIFFSGCTLFPLEKKDAARFFLFCFVLFCFALGAIIAIVVIHSYTAIFLSHDAGQTPTDDFLEDMINEAPGSINFTMFLTLFGDRLAGAYLELEDEIALQINWVMKGNGERKRKKERMKESVRERWGQGGSRKAMWPSDISFLIL